MKPLIEFHPDIMEEPFRRQVRSIARMYGWTMQYHTHNSKFSDGGFPDEVYVHPLYNRVLFVEFKRQKGAIKPKQVEWLVALGNCGLETALWRPSDGDEILAVLGPIQQRTKWVPPVKRARRPAGNGGPSPLA